MGARSSVEEIHGGSANVAVYPYCALQMTAVPPGLLGLPQSALSTVSFASNWITTVATSRMRDVA